MSKPINVNPARPVEKMIGNNRLMIEHICGNIHVMTNDMEVYRMVRRKLKSNWKSYPKALRRGFALCVLETIHNYRQTFIDVMSGNLN